MFDFIYYPISGILWLWHYAFEQAAGLGSGPAWALSIVFLVFTIRALLYRPVAAQMRMSLKMQELRPQMKALQKRYGKDRQRYMEEVQKLQKEHGLNPLMGCVPVVVQAIAFLGIFHVLRSFNRTGSGFGQIGMTPELNATTPNYFFSVDQVHSFLSAHVFGAPLGVSAFGPLSAPDAFAVFGLTPAASVVAAVALPLGLAIAVLTHVNARASIARQSPELAASPQTAIMNRIMLWVFPAGALIGAPFMPVAILIYLLSNNIWTYGQQHVVYRHRR